MKRILFISNLYPNQISPNMAAYNRQQIAALREICEVEVISPIPWTALVKRKPYQVRATNDGGYAHHPTYFYTPRMLRTWYGEFFYFSIKNVAQQLLEKKQFDLIFSSWLYPDSWAAAKLAKHYNLPLFVKVHGSDVNRLKLGSRLAFRSLEGIRQAEKIICVSKALKERLIELGVSEKKLEILYNGVDHSIFHPMNKEDVRRLLKIDPDEFLVLYVGNLKKEKGLHELIVAFKSLKAGTAGKSRLVIIGTGAYGPVIEQLVLSHDLSGHVHLAGCLPLETIALWMNAASVLCLPSYMEGVPNVVLEALSCNTRVVATRVGGIPELDRGDGMLTLVPPCESSELADALLQSSGDSCTACNASPIASWQENARQLYSILSGNQ